MAFAMKTKTEVAAEAAENITLENAHALNLYQLRQELTRRGIFDDIFGAEGEKKTINFNSLLQVLVAELAKEEEARQAAHAAEVEAALGRATPATADGAAPAGETLAEKLAREKAERKAQALERSAKRQAEKAYFAKKKEENEKLAKEKEEREKAAAESGGVTEIEAEAEEAPAEEATQGAWRSNVIG